MKTIFSLLAFMVALTSSAQCFQAFSTNTQHSMALKTDGTLWSWGNNNNGELGLNTAVAPIYTPRLVNAQMAGAKIFTGGDKSFVIKSDGTLWACGNGDFGGLGTGNQNDKYALTQIGTDTNWDYVSPGSGTIAFKTDGTLWGWGANIYGMLNLGAANLQMTPIQISTETNWAKVIAAGNHTLGIKTDGTLWACGLNNHGQLGDGTTVNRFNFVQIGTDTNWADFGTGFLFESSLAIKTDGTLWGWGSNLNNQLGSGLPSQVTVPTQLGTATNWANASKTYYTTLGVKTDGTLWISSASGFNQIGTETNWVKVHSGEMHYFGIKSDGTLWGRGNNLVGQLGLGPTVDVASVFTQLNCDAFLGLDEVTPAMNISVYPNPTSDVLFIQNDSNLTIEKITVTDMSGKILFATTTNFSEVNLQSFQRGLYILHLSTVNQQLNYKIIKK